MTAAVIRMSLPKPQSLEGTRQLASLHVHRHATLYIWPIEVPMH